MHVHYFQEEGARVTVGVSGIRSLVASHNSLDPVNSLYGRPGLRTNGGMRGMRSSI